MIRCFRPYATGFTLAAFLLFTSRARAEAPALTPLHISGGKIVDASGSVVMLRGVCVNQLGDYFQGNPGVPATLPLTRRDFERIAALGCNSVRLIVSWSALEPQPRMYDRAYLARVREAVGWARDCGLYVVLDMHQDAWGKYIASDPERRCPWPLIPNIGWDGAPEWATITGGRERCKLIQRELAPAVMASWENFWNNRDGVRDRLAEAWGRLAAEFRDESAVAGYDLLNEPNWGYDLARTVRTRKPAFHRACVDAIRAAEAGAVPKLIFFEPVAIWSVLPGEKPIKFTDDPNLVYAPHIYLGSISIDMFLFHRELIPLRSGFKKAAKEAAFFHTTFWNGEWMPGPGDHPQRYAALEDEFQTGSARWVWKMSCGDPHQMSLFWPDRTRTPEGLSHNVVVLRCGDPAEPGGVDEGINPIDAKILARPWPRAFPAPATFTSDPETRVLRIEGESAGNVPLSIWVPGSGQPRIDSAGVDQISWRQAGGGWIVTALPRPGAWSLTAAAAE